MANFNATRRKMLAALALGAACSGSASSGTTSKGSGGAATSAGSSGGMPSGAGGAEATSSAVGTSSGRTSVSSASTTTGGGGLSGGGDLSGAGGLSGGGGLSGAGGSGGGAGGAGGGAGFTCNPPAPAGSFYAQSAPAYGMPTSTAMCKYTGDVLLVVNTADVDAYTPQVAGLQILESTFGAQGFHVLGFLSDDFGNLGGSSGEIAACNAMYGLTFPQFAIGHVTSGFGGLQPVFAWLQSQPNPGPSASVVPTWNFSKYLISRKGDLIGDWDAVDYPGKDPNNPASTFSSSPIVIAIEAELAK